MMSAGGSCATGASCTAAAGVGDGGGVLLRARTMRQVLPSICLALAPLPRSNWARALAVDMRPLIAGVAMPASDWSDMPMLAPV